MARPINPLLPVHLSPLISPCTRSGFSRPCAAPRACVLIQSIENKALPNGGRPDSASALSPVPLPFALPQRQQVRRPTSEAAHV